MGPFVKSICQLWSPGGDRVTFKSGSTFARLKTEEEKGNMNYEKLLKESSKSYFRETISDNLKIKISHKDN